MEKMCIEHVIEYHKHKARELEDEFNLDRRKTRLRDEMMRHLQVAYTMQRWPDYTDFTDIVGGAANNNHPGVINSHRS